MALSKRQNGDVCVVPWLLLASKQNLWLQGRYSFVGAQPSLEVVAKGSNVEVTRHPPGNEPAEVTTREISDPLQVRPGVLTDSRACTPTTTHRQRVPAPATQKWHVGLRKFYSSLGEHLTGGT